MKQTKRTKRHFAHRPIPGSQHLIHPEGALFEVTNIHNGLDR